MLTPRGHASAHQDQLLQPVLLETSHSGSAVACRRLCLTRLTFFLLALAFFDDLWSHYPLVRSSTSGHSNLRRSIPFPTARATHAPPYLVIFDLVFRPLLVSENVFFFSVVLRYLGPLVGLFVLISVVAAPRGFPSHLLDFSAICWPCQPSCGICCICV